MEEAHQEGQGVGEHLEEEHGVVVQEGVEHQVETSWGAALGEDHEVDERLQEESLHHDDSCPHHPPLVRVMTYFHWRLHLLTVQTIH